MKPAGAREEVWYTVVMRSYRWCVIVFVLFLPVLVLAAVVVWLWQLFGIS